MKKADLILCADLHLREDTPICRTDDYMEAQKTKLDFIANLAETHDCLVVCSGDVFHKAKPSLFLLSWAMKNIPFMTTIPGNHDLPNHSMKLFGHSGLNILKETGKLLVMDKNSDLCQGFKGDIENNTTGFFTGVPYGEEVPEFTPHTDGNSKEILFLHTMTYKSKKPWEGLVAPKAISLLNKYPEYDLIVTGHNHKPFTVKHEGRLLVNPGSLMRMSADEIDFKPRVYLWYQETNTVKKVYLPINKNVITREHIELKESKNRRLEDFIHNIKKTYEVGLSFEQNMENALNNNKIPNETKEIIRRVMCQ